MKFLLFIALTSLTSAVNGYNIYSKPLPALSDRPPEASKDIVLQRVPVSDEMLLPSPPPAKTRLSKAIVVRVPVHKQEQDYPTKTYQEGKEQERLVIVVPVLSSDEGRKVKSQSSSKTQQESSTDAQYKPKLVQKLPFSSKSVGFRSQKQSNSDQQRYNVQQTLNFPVPPSDQKLYSQRPPTLFNKRLNYEQKYSFRDSKPKDRPINFDVQQPKINSASQGIQQDNTFDSQQRPNNFNLKDTNYGTSFVRNVQFPTIQKPTSSFTKDRDFDSNQNYAQQQPNTFAKDTDKAKPVNFEVQQKLGFVSQGIDHAVQQQDNTFVPQQRPSVFKDNNFEIRRPNAQSPRGETPTTFFTKNTDFNSQQTDGFSSEGTNYGGIKPSTFENFRGSSFGQQQNRNYASQQPSTFTNFRSQQSDVLPDAERNYGNLQPSKSKFGDKSKSFIQQKPTFGNKAVIYDEEREAPSAEKGNFFGVQRNPSLNTKDGNKPNSAKFFVKDTQRPQYSSEQIKSGKILENENIPVLLISIPREQKQGPKPDHGGWKPMITEKDTKPLKSSSFDLKASSENTKPENNRKASLKYSKPLYVKSQNRFVKAPLIGFSQHSTNSDANKNKNDQSSPKIFNLAQAGFGKLGDNHQEPPSGNINQPGSLTDRPESGYGQRPQIPLPPFNQPGPVIGRPAPSYEQRPQIPPPAFHQQSGPVIDGTAPSYEQRPQIPPPAFHQQSGPVLDGTVPSYEQRPQIPPPEFQQQPEPVIDRPEPSYERRPQIPPIPFNQPGPLVNGPAPNYEQRPQIPPPVFQQQPGPEIDTPEPSYEQRPQIPPITFNQAGPVVDGPAPNYEQRPWIPPPVFQQQSGPVTDRPEPSYEQRPQILPITFNQPGPVVDEPAPSYEKRPQIPFQQHQQPVAGGLLTTYEQRPQIPAVAFNQPGSVIDRPEPSYEQRPQIPPRFNQPGLVPDGPGQSYEQRPQISTTTFQQQPGHVIDRPVSDYDQRPQAPDQTFNQPGLRPNRPEPNYEQRPQSPENKFNQPKHTSDGSKPDYDQNPQIPKKLFNQDRPEPNFEQRPQIPSTTLNNRPEFSYEQRPQAPVTRFNQPPPVTDKPQSNYEQRQQTPIGRFNQPQPELDTTRENYEQRPQVHATMFDQPKPILDEFQNGDYDVPITMLNQPQTVIDKPQGTYEQLPQVNDGQMVMKTFDEQSGTMDIFQGSHQNENQGNFQATVDDNDQEHRSQEQGENKGEIDEHKEADQTKQSKDGLLLVLVSTKDEKQAKDKDGEYSENYEQVAKGDQQGPEQYYELAETVVNGRKRIEVNIPIRRASVNAFTKTNDYHTGYSIVY